MSTKKNTKKTETNKPVEDILESSVITSQKINRKNNIIISLLLIIIIILCFVIVFVAFNKKCSNTVKCRSNAPVDKNIQYQYINYNGYRFSMPLDWNFISDENTYEISDEKETIYITLSSIDVSYEEFIAEEYQKTFLEEFQTSNNITINKSYKGQSNKIDYYLLEGTLNSYNYCVVVIGDEEKVVLTSTQFVDKLTFTKMKQSVIDFAVSGKTNKKI